MADEVPVPRVAASGRPATVTQKAIRLGIIEMGDYEDADYFYKGLKKKCKLKVENISPAAAKGKSLHKHHKQWKDYRQAIIDRAYTGKSVGEPHWWYWSGHHAGMGDGTYYAEAGQAGFFNDHYYKAWKKYTNDKGKTTFPSEIEGAVFMITGGVQSALTRPPEFQRSNPVFSKDDSDCVGMMLIGCNTLSYASSQATLCDEFGGIPVIFGYWQAKAPGGVRQQNAHIRHILNAPQRANPSFFEDPDTFFGQNGGAEKCIKEMVGKISRKTRKRRIAVLHDQSLYVPEYAWPLRRWMHSYGMNIIVTANEQIAEGVKFRTCPVPGKENPFTYDGADDRFIVGCKRSRTTIGDTLQWRVLAATPGFKKIDSLLAYTADHIFKRAKAEKLRAPKLLSIKNAGTQVELQFSGHKIMEGAAKGGSDYGYSLTRDGTSDRYVLAATK